MTRNRQTIEDILKRHIRSAPADEMESDAARVLRLLRLEKEQDADRAAAQGAVDAFLVPHSVRPAPRASRFAWATVAAVLLVLSVAGIRNFVLNSNTAAFVDTNDAEVRLGYGEIIRSDSGSGAVLVLKDGSQIEMRSKSQLALEAAEDGVRIRLDSGSVIVTAAKQRTGHLYVQTRDLTASVLGTVFVVMAEETGSRVAVIQGEVRVEQGGNSRKLMPGEQVATNPLMEPHPVSREVSWSRQAETHLALLQQAAAPAAVTPKRLAFEVASIKLETPGGAESLSITPQCQGVDGLLRLSNVYIAPLIDLDPKFQPAPPVAPKGRCVARRTSLANLIGVAYGVDVFLTASLGGPRWAQGFSDGLQFQVEAKAEDPETATKAQLQQMLQSMLADRFKLKVSWQTREVEGFVVYIGKDGTRLAGASNEEALKQQEMRNGQSVERVITGKASVKDFIEFIGLRSPLISRMGSSDAILDRTDLKGIYTFHLVYAVPPVVPVGDNSGRRGGGVPVFGEISPALANFRDALQEQLGLRLEFAKIPTDIPVIEHAETPSEN